MTSVDVASSVLDALTVGGKVVASSDGELTLDERSTEPEDASLDCEEAADDIELTTELTSELADEMNDETEELMSELVDGWTDASDELTTELTSERLETGNEAELELLSSTILELTEGVAES